jgi:hypothetical protein
MMTTCEQAAQLMKFEEEESSNLTVEQCEELTVAIAGEAALLSPGSRKEALLNLAQSYRDLATMKALIARKLNWSRRVEAASLGSFERSWSATLRHCTRAVSALVKAETARSFWEQIPYRPSPRSAYVGGAAVDPIRAADPGCGDGFDSRKLSLSADQQEVDHRRQIDLTEPWR